MTIVLNKKDGKKALNQALEKALSKPKKGFDAHKYCGTIKWKEGALKDKN